MDTLLQLGQAAGLLFGYRPVWEPKAGTVPFFAPPVAPVLPATVDPVLNPYPEWSNTPTITIHDSAESLLDTLYGYRVDPMSGDPAGIDVPPGPLALNDADGVAALAAARAAPAAAAPRRARCSAWISRSGAATCWCA